LEGGRLVHVLHVQAIYCREQQIAHGEDVEGHVEYDGQHDDLRTHPREPHVLLVIL